MKNLVFPRQDGRSGGNREANVGAHMAIHGAFAKCVGGKRKSERWNIYNGLTIPFYRNAPARRRSTKVSKKIFGHLLECRKRCGAERRWPTTSFVLMVLALDTTTALCCGYVQLMLGTPGVQARVVAEKLISRAPHRLFVSEIAANSNVASNEYSATMRTRCGRIVAPERKPAAGNRAVHNYV